MIRDLIQIGSVVLAFLVLVSCSVDKPELNGVYTAQNFTESIDTLELKESGIYYRSIYDKNENKLIFKGIGEWEFKNGEIILNDFLSNMDELQYYNSLVNYDNTLSTTYLRVDRRIFDGIQIIIHKDLKYFYKKL